MTSVARARRRPRAVLFDLDGTLIDTRSGMRAALKAALRDIVGDDAAAQDANLSLPLEAMIRTAIPSESSPVITQVATAFRGHYDARDWKQARLYPGAQACLQGLQRSGIRAFLVTNKRAGAATRLLERFGLAPYFEMVFGQPEVAPPVPKSQLARACAAIAGLDSASTYVVGDSDADAVMAKSQHMMFIAFTAGAGPLSQAAPGSDRVEMGSLVDVGAFFADKRLWRES